MKAPEPEKSHAVQSISLEKKILKIQVKGFIFKNIDENLKKKRGKRKKILCNYFSPYHPSREL